MKYVKRTFIPVAPYGHVDITGLEPIIDSVPFQRQYRISQLGYASKKFRSATHNRGVHQLGALHLVNTLIIPNPNVHLDDEEKMLVALQALLHDIGHGPFSHQLDGLVGIDHKERGYEILLNDLKTAFGKIGIRPEDLVNSYKKLLNELISMPYGVDKAEYLITDPLFTGHGPSLDPNFIGAHGVFHRDMGFCIEERGLDDLLNLINLYYNMHFGVYYNKTAMTAESMLGRAMNKSITQKKINPDELYRLRESDVEEILRKDDPDGLMRRLDEGPDYFYKSAIAFKIQGFDSKEPNNGKFERILISEEQAMKFPSERNGLGHLIELEHQISSRIGVPIIISTTPNPNRLRLLGSHKEPRIYVPHGDNNSRRLSEVDPEYARYIATHVGNIWVARVLCPEDDRKLVRSKAAEIAAQLFAA